MDLRCFREVTYCKRVHHVDSVKFFSSSKSMNAPCKYVLTPSIAKNLAQLADKWDLGIRSERYPESRTLVTILPEHLPSLMELTFDVASMTGRSGPLESVLSPVNLPR